MLVGKWTSQYSGPQLDRPANAGLVLKNCRFSHRSDASQSCTAQSRLTHPSSSSRQPDPKEGEVDAPSQFPVWYPSKTISPLVQSELENGDRTNMLLKPLHIWYFEVSEGNLKDKQEYKAQRDLCWPFFKSIF